MYRENASSLHIKAYESLLELFLPVEIQQEYKVRNDDNGRWLWFDFFLPNYGVAIEVQGQQHFAFNQFFHNDKTDFILQRRRDEVKELWCDRNGIILVKVNYDDDITSTLIQERIREGKEKLGE